MEQDEGVKGKKAEHGTLECSLLAEPSNGLSGPHNEMAVVKDVTSQPYNLPLYSCCMPHLLPPEVIGYDAELNCK